MSASRNEKGLSWKGDVASSVFDSHVLEASQDTAESDIAVLGDDIAILVGPVFVSFEPRVDIVEGIPYIGTHALPVVVNNAPSAFHRLVDGVVLQSLYGGENPSSTGVVVLEQVGVNEQRRGMALPDFGWHVSRWELVPVVNRQAVLQHGETAVRVAFVLIVAHKPVRCQTWSALARKCWQSDTQVRVRWYLPICRQPVGRYGVRQVQGVEAVTLRE